MKVTSEFIVSKIDPDTLVYCIGEGSQRFQATITLNANDAMVFAQVTQCPEESSLRIRLLQDFKDVLYNHYGGKTFLKIDPVYFQDAITAGFISKPFIGPVKREITNALMITRENLEDALQKFSPQREQELTLLKNIDLRGRGEELFAFKKANASFVNEDKIERGLYSADAEEKKLHNMNNLVFALVDKSNKLVATLMLSVHGNWIYGADFIVDKELQKKGLGKHLCFLANQQVANMFPKVNVWLIGGGHEEDDLYQKLFGAITINEKSQREHGMFLFFTQPGEALNAAIRETAKSRYNLSEARVAKQIGFLASPSRIIDESKLRVVVVSKQKELEDKLESGVAVFVVPTLLTPMHIDPQYVYLDEKDNLYKLTTANNSPIPDGLISEEKLRDPKQLSTVLGRVLSVHEMLKRGIEITIICAHSERAKADNKEGFVDRKQIDTLQERYAKNLHIKFIDKHLFEQYSQQVCAATYYDEKNATFSGIDASQINVTEKHHEWGAHDDQKMKEKVMALQKLLQTCDLDLFRVAGSVAGSHLDL
jgi:hypothetical protein